MSITNKSVVIDTCSIMSDNSIIENIIGLGYSIVINIVTVEELDNLKNNTNYYRAKEARHAIRAIENLKSKITFDVSRNVDIALVSTNPNVHNINDDIIVTCAKETKSLLVTNDLNLKVKAELINVEVLDYNLYDFYKGYVEYAFTEDEYNDYYEHRQEYFKEYYQNEYIIINILGSNKSVEYRFDGEDLVALKLPSSKFIKAKNSLQRCALDMLNNNNIEICALLGTMGSGKTYLALQMALNSIKNTGKQSKLLGVRSPYGTGKDIGYLKGTFEDKTSRFFTPLVHSLDGGVYELQKYIDNGEFDVNIPFYMKGTTYNSTIVICDEAEDLTEAEIRLVGTRLGENSRIFFSGDYKQSEIDKSNSNPLIKMCEEFKGKPNFACICFSEDVRSEASKMFATLYEK